MATVDLRDHLNISRFAIHHPRLTIGFWLAIAMAGLFAFSSLKYALFPDITFPVVVVSARAEQPSAAATATALTAPLEAAFQDLEGLENIRSTTQAGVATITLTAAVGQSLGELTAAAGAAIAQAEVPPEAEVSIVPLNLNESAAVTYAVGSESLDLAAIATRLRQDVLPDLEALEGVLRVNLLGTGLLEDRPDSDDLETLLANPQTLTRFNGEDGVALQVIKRSEANTLEVVWAADAAIARWRAAEPELVFAQAATQADYIRRATQATIDALLGAIILAILIIFPFLRNWQATAIAALTIPLSLLGTFIVMALSGFNLETITLLALALVIGIVVDDAIVEIENISRHIDSGSAPRQAALLATREIGLTVAASTLTIVAVFLPVAFMGGTVGQFFKPFGLTVSTAVIISLLAARTLTPVLAIYWLRAQPPVATPAALAEPPSRLAQSYDQLLSWALKQRRLVVAIALLSCLAGLALIPLIPKGFIPSLDRGEFNILYSTTLPAWPAADDQGPPPAPETEAPARDANPSGTQREEPLFAEGAFDWLAGAVSSPQALLLSEARDLARDLEAATLAHPDVASVFTTVGLRGAPHRGRLQVLLREDRQHTTAEVQAQLRQDLPRPEGVMISVEDPQFVEIGDEKPLQVGLLGANVKTLSAIAQRVQQTLATDPSFADVTATGGSNLSGSVREIQHLNGRPIVYLEANLPAGQALGDATERVVEAVKAIAPTGLEIDLGGDSVRSNQVLGSFARTLSLSMGCMLLLLILPFGRLLEPLVVGLCLPLALSGAMLALLVTGSDFGMISLLGLLFLLGLLDKNALLLMDYINQLRHQGRSRTQAILETGLVRLRPILMTTASTVLGMLPIALGLGAGAELRQPMAVAIIGGLLASTLLSLIVVPVLYTLLEDSWQRLRGQPKPSSPGPCSRGDQGS